MTVSGEKGTGFMDWDFFYRQLEAGLNINETSFYFFDDK